MSQKVSLVMSATALVLVVLATTPLGAVAQNLVPRNSVGPPQLKRNAVTPRKLAPNAVRTGHVLDGSLLSADFKSGQIPAGPKGDKGDKGDRGEPASTRAHRVFELGTLDSTAVKSVQVMCPAGEVALGGGFNIGKVEPQPAVSVLLSLPIVQGDRPVGWQVEVVEVGAYGNSWRPVVSAVCAPTS
jgi:hypothetical protein